MIEKLNNLIDINLNLICETKDNKMFASDFLDLNGKRIFSKFESEKFADKMVSEKLISRTNELCIVEDFGCKVFKNGGWLKYLELKNENEKTELNKSEFKDTLEIEIKILQKDNLEHQKTIRKQNDRIRDLDEQIKFISLIKLYWWLIPTCIAIGIFLAKGLDLIMQ